ncbi:MAG: hypothetical protein SFU98_22685 [Leptospiraceae bacterium]|nr:hypothetical protein [Leptospiraceae bacterium]
MMPLSNIIIFARVAFFVLLFNFLDCKKKEEPKLENESSTKIELKEVEEPNPNEESRKLANPTIPNPAGLIAIAEVKGDLDNDSEEELVVVYNTKENDLGIVRELHIFKKQESGWKLWKKFSGPVLSSQAGGMMGDPFQEILIEKGILKISHFGGSRQKWGYLHKYRFKDETWTLIGAYISHGAPCEENEILDYNLSTGMVEYSKILEVCDSTGNEIKTPKKSTKKFSMKLKKPIEMNGFTPGTNELKLTKSKNFYY